MLSIKNSVRKVLAKRLHRMRAGAPQNDGNAAQDVAQDDSANDIPIIHTGCTIPNMQIPLSCVPRDALDSMRRRAGGAS